jgi:hypothetical protein
MSGSVSYTQQQPVTAYFVAWLPPDPAPTLPPHGIPTASVLTRQFGGNPWLNNVLTAWADPLPLPTLPIQFGKHYTPSGPPQPPKPVGGNAVYTPHNVNAFGASPVYVVPNNVYGAIVPVAGLQSVQAIGGTAFAAAVGPLNGGYITNPANAAAQGIGAAENLYIDLTRPPGATDALANGTTVLITAGQTFTIPAIAAGVYVWVNAATTNHAFTLVVW